MVYIDYTQKNMNEFFFLRKIFVFVQVFIYSVAHAMPGNQHKQLPQHFEGT